MFFDVDERFRNHLQSLEQVFVYLIDECNLRCDQCLYKPDLTFHLKEKEIELETALALVSDFREMGASKLTLMGGEPTLYGASENHRSLIQVIHAARNVGYDYVRMDTNGIFDPSLLPRLKGLNEITFSLDGPTPEINDALRGNGAFDKCVGSIQRAVSLGLRVDITCCLHRGLIRRDESGQAPLDSMIEFAERLGARTINFHDLFKCGIPRDVWTGAWDLSLMEWITMYHEVQKNIEAGKYRIHVRIPQCFATREEFQTDPEYYGYCPAKLGERLLVHPNGIIRICSLLIGTPYGIARFYNRKIVRDESPTNELRAHQLNTPTPCTNQCKGVRAGDYLPLCVSFKPRQHEIVWAEKLRWEAKRKQGRGPTLVAP